MVYINEWLPNPTGSDLANEFVELFNGGDKAANLSGWVLKTNGKSKITLTGTLGAGEYALLRRKDTKLALKNSDEKLFLYDASGRLVDQSAFMSLAIEGKSFSRVSYDQSGAQHFAWSAPTPGAKNAVAADAGILRMINPVGVPLGKNLGISEFSGLAFASALAVTALLMFALKKHENLSKLFFARDEEIW